MAAPPHNSTYAHTLSVPEAYAYHPGDDFDAYSPYVHVAEEGGLTAPPGPPGSPGSPAPAVPPPFLRQSTLMRYDPAAAALAPVAAAPLSAAAAAAAAASAAASASASASAATAGAATTAAAVPAAAGDAAPAAKQLFDPSSRNWTSELCDSLNMPMATEQQRLQRLSRIRNLIADFQAAARALSAAIVSGKVERSALGGLAGGIKFVSANIMFKLARSSHGIYATHADAAKAAAHELRSLNAIVRQSVDGGISLPLFCVVDVRGWRVVAESLLPISGDTLVYGSEDQGRTFSTASGAAAQAMARLGQRLNLCSHTVRDNAGKTLTMVGPADVEVHLGFEYVARCAIQFTPSLLGCIRSRRVCVCVCVCVVCVTSPFLSSIQWAAVPV